MIVSNSTPLISFARINQLPLLRRIVGDLVIPQAVADEITDYAGERGRIELTQERWIRVQAVRNQGGVRLLLASLDRGEAEVIMLAQEQNADLVLIDELTARKVAESLDLNVFGSIGVLIRAKEIGQITSVKPLIEEMIQQGIRYNPRFIAAVLWRIGE